MKHTTTISTRVGLLAALLLVLLLAACGRAPAPVQQSVETFAFTVDPQAGTVTVNAVTPQGDANPPILVLDSYSYGFLPGNILHIDASFLNNTSDQALFDIVFSEDPSSTVLYSTMPTLQNAMLGPDMELTPGESTPVLAFEAEHAGAPFSFFVNAAANMRTIQQGCTVTITNPSNGDTVSSNVLVQGSITPAGVPTALSYSVNGGSTVALTPANPFSFSVSSTDLVQGSNTISVHATVGTSACEDSVEVAFDPETPPPAGTDLVVFNDINVFDSTGMQNANNVTMVQNLVGYPATGGPRDTADHVAMDFSKNSKCRGTGECSDSRLDTMYTTITNAGYAVDTSIDLLAIPSNVRVIFLWNPRVAYSTAEINALKTFAAEGGRIVFIGEHSGYYGTWIGSVENPFLAAMGAVMTNLGFAIDCGYVDQPSSSMRPHQITNGMNGVRMACSSTLQLGPNDFPLYTDRSQQHILSAVAKIDVTITPTSATAATANDLHSQGVTVERTGSNAAGY